MFEEGALTAPSPTPTLHSASSSTVPCSETLLPGPCPQLRGQLDRALRWGQRHGLPRLLSVQLIGPRRAGSGCPCLRLWPSSGWVGSSWWAAKDRGGGGLQQWKASSRLQAGVQLRVSWGLRRTARHPGSPASLVVAASSCLGLCPLHGCLLCVSPSALTSSYKETHHWIEGPPSSSLIWRDGGVRVEYLGVPSSGVGNTDFKAAAGGGTRRSSRWERSALGAAQPARRLVERWSWWGRTQQGWFSLPATDASARPDGTILPGSNWPCGQRPMSALLLLEGPEVCSCGDGGMSTCDFAGSRLAPYPRTRVSESCPMVSAPRPTLSLGGEREAHGRAPSGHTWEPLASGPAGQ